MAVKDSREDVTATVVVIDEDTVRYGGSAFKRERTCRYELKVYGYYEDWVCSECGHIENNGIGNYCPECGAKVVQDCR